MAGCSGKRGNGVIVIWRRGWYIYVSDDRRVTRGVCKWATGGVSLPEGKEKQRVTASSFPQNIIAPTCILDSSKMSFETARIVYFFAKISNAICNA